MKNYFVIFCIIIIWFVNSCAPVRNTRQAPPKGKQISSNLSKTKPSITKQQKSRFSDTTVVIVQSAAISTQSNISNQFDNAVDNFDKEKFDSACTKFRMFSETLVKGDSLYYESKFYVCECFISKDDIVHAEPGLLSLYEAPDLPRTIYERVLVRLGQVYCALDKKKEAEKLFLKLKKEFPNSIYIPLANCDAVK